jgi:predicted transcriptional regulator
MSTTKIMYRCNIDPEVSEKFTIALMLNKEDADAVIEKLMSQYISESFSKASKSFSPSDNK